MNQLTLLVVFVLGSTSLVFSETTFRLIGGQASPGATLRVPLMVHTTSGAFSVYSFSINFDEEVLQATRYELVAMTSGCEFDITDCGGDRTRGGYFVDVDNGNQQPGNGLDEGWIIGVQYFGLRVWAQITLAPNIEHEVLAFYFQVKNPSSVLSTEISFINGLGPPRGGVMTNAIGVWEVGEEYAVTQPATLFVNAFMQIVREPEFRRGDLNSDGALDLSDAIGTLDYLFVGNTESTCQDAADANDDGVVNISDPISSLSFLFLGGPAPPEPRGACGVDPTEDSLNCQAYSGC